MSDPGWYYLSHAFQAWYIFDVLPIAYGEEYEDPKCPCAKIPLEVLGVLGIALCFLLDTLLIPVYCVRYAIIQRNNATAQTTQT